MITIIEASSQLGGRVRSVPFGGVTVELGARGLYGTKMTVNASSFFNSFNRRAQTLGMTWKEVDYDDYIFRDEQGSDVTNEADQEYISYDRVVSAVLDDLYSGSGSSLSLRDRQNMEGFWPAKPVQRTLEWYEFDFNKGDSAPNSAARSQTFYYESVYGEGEAFLTDARGHKALVDDIAGEFLVLDDPRVKLDETVRGVEQAGDVVRVNTTRGVYEADYVIVTVSIGVLQHNMITFTPQFSEERTNALFKYNMGHLKQMYLKFSDLTTPFWDDVQNILHVHRTPGYFPHICNLNKFGHGTNILLLSVTGSEAVRLDALSDNQVRDEIMSVLRSMYGLTIPYPTDFLTYSWSQDPLAFGSFASWPPGLTGSDHQLLRSTHGRVHFAGEGFSETYPGAIYGAMSSAKQQADELIDCMETDDC